MRGIPPTSYITCDRIIGCLKEVGWFVIRCIQIVNATYESISKVSDSGHNGRVTQKPYWTSIEDVNSNCVVKYRHSSTPHPNWSNEGNCVNFMKDIKTQVLNKILNGENYIVEKYNLMKNQW